MKLTEKVYVFFQLASSCSSRYFGTCKLSMNLTASRCVVYWIEFSSASAVVFLMEWTVCLCVVRACNRANKQQKSTDKKKKRKHVEYFLHWCTNVYRSIRKFKREKKKNNPRILKSIFCVEIRQHFRFPLKMYIYIKSITRTSRENWSVCLRIFFSSFSSPMIYNPMERA